MIGKIFGKMKEFFIACLQGKILMKMTRYFSLIVYIFGLMWVTILIRMGAETTLRAVERNKDIIQELKIEHANMTIELASFNRISTVEKLLEDKGSKVEMPDKPADVIEK